MAVETVNAGGMFRLGGVLRRAWRLLTGDVLFFLAVPVLIYAAIVVGGGYATSVLASAMPNLNLHTQPEWVLALAIFLGIILPLGLNMVGQAALLPRAAQRLRGQPLRAGEALRKTLARLVPLLGLVLLWCLALCLCLVSSALFLSFALWGLVGGGVVSSYVLILLSPYTFTLLSALLFPASLVPTAILLVVSAVAVPACVVERLGPLASMIRSIALTKGHRWKIFGIMLLLALLSVGGKIIDQLVAPDGSGFAIAVDAVWFVPLIAYWNATVIMTYHGLRVAKEGVDTGQIAEIFD